MRPAPRRPAPRGNQSPQQQQSQSVIQLSDSSDEEGTISESETVTATPEFRTVEEFQEFVKITKMKEEIIADQMKFIAENYPARRNQLSAQMTVLIDKMWVAIPDENKRRDYGGFVNIVMTFTELYYFTIKVMEGDYRSGDRSYIPTDLMDKFLNYFTTIEECRTKEGVDISNYSDMLSIRDKVIEAIREHYTVGVPMLRGQRVYEPVPEVEERYFPFDYEWLCGQITSGAFYSAYMRYVYLSRMYSIDISYRRLQIIAASRNLEDKDNLKEFRMLVPFVATNPYAIDKALKYNEDACRINYTRLHRKVVRDHKVRIPESIFTHVMERIGDLCGKIRRKKARFLSDLANCEIKSIKSKLRVIGVLSSMDALCLLLQRVYGFYLDDERGFVGEPIPLDVLKPLDELFYMVDDDCCGGIKGNPLISDKLNVVREAVHRAIESFYLEKMENCHRHFEAQARPVALAVDDCHYSLNLTDYPSSIAQHAKKMLWHLYVQEFELTRLNRELYRARDAFTRWPRGEDVPPFMINTCRGTISFASNYKDVIDSETINEQMEAEALKDMTYAAPERYVYVRMMRVVHTVMAQFHGQATHVELRDALRTQFEDIFSAQTLNRKNAHKLADEFSMMMTIHFSLVDHKPEFLPLAKSSLVAPIIAKNVVEIYMDYVLNNMKNPPKRSALPKRDCPPVFPKQSVTLHLERSCLAFYPSDSEMSEDEQDSEPGTSGGTSEPASEEHEDDSSSSEHTEGETDDSDAETVREDDSNEPTPQPVDVTAS
ncbi:hypothetical protein CAEBREN_23709 [Caenorhabditis brenneri]|uniref:Uncharacterized protein n=1 Tax=Caenorhabditis brenneri TaxID=135651 RepID=G0MSU8_CAEBE|nr:hypothetical protein CAEBREN_23709 [Caenorhabditis brenneri]